MVQANALFIIPEGEKFLEAGSYVKAWLLDIDELSIL
jgi:molybdopterin biosynthesis enzyme